MRDYDRIAAIIAHVDPRAGCLWTELRGSTRILFDALAAEWGNLPMESKLIILKALETAGLLDMVLRDHINSYWPGRPHSMPYVLDGLEPAISQYEDAGFRIDPPVNLPYLVPVGIPVILLLASLIRMLEKRQVLELSPRYIRQLRRLRQAIDRYLDGLQKEVQK